MFDRDLESWVQVEKSYESDGKWIVEGWASTSEVDSESLRMSKEALEDMRKEFEVMRTVLHNHNADEEIGTVLDTDLRKKSSTPEIWGCWVKVLISKTVPKIWQKIQEKVLNKFSVKGKSKVQEIFEGGRIVQEAMNFIGAELSLVSVPALRAATVEEIYIQKLLKSFKKGRSPMSKELERISLQDAKVAISDLVKDEKEKTEVMKILDAMQESVSEEEVEKINLQTAKERIETLIEDGDAKESIMKILDSVEEVVEKEEPEKEPEKEIEKEIDPEAEKAIEKAKEEHEVMESLAGGLKTLYEKVKAAAGKDAEAALKDLKTIAEQMKKLVEAYPYPYPATAKKEEEEEEKAAEEEEKVEKEETSESDLALGKFAEALENINKSLEEAAKNVHDEQVVKMGEMILGIEEKVEKLTNVIENEVPIRKALVDSEKKRVEKKKSIIDSEEYESKTPAEKLRTLFAARTESSE